MVYVETVRLYSPPQEHLNAWPCPAHLRYARQGMQASKKLCSQASDIMACPYTYLVIQVEVQVIPQQQIEQGLLAVVIMTQCGSPLEC